MGVLLGACVCVCMYTSVQKFISFLIVVKYDSMSLINCIESKIVGPDVIV